MYWLLDRHQTISLPGLCPHYNIVDGDVDELDKEADEAHDTKANSSGNGNLGELLPVGLGAPLDRHTFHQNQPSSPVADAAKKIKAGFDEKYGGNWMVIVGEGYGLYFAHQAENF